MFRYGAPSTSGIETLSTEGTKPSGTRSLSLTKIDKSLIQRGQVIELTDILTQTDLFNSLQQSIKTQGEDAALDLDTLTRNTLVGSNVAGDAKENGDGSALDNSDSLNEMYAGGSTDYTDFCATTSGNTLAASDILDAVTKLKINRATPAKGGMYVAVVSPQVLSDVMKINEWLNAAQYSNVSELYKGEVGSLFGAKFIETTNPFVGGNANTADDDRFDYDASAGNGVAADKNVYATCSSDNRHTVCRTWVRSRPSARRSSLRTGRTRATHSIRRSQYRSNATGVRCDSTRTTTLLCAPRPHTVAKNKTDHA